MPNIPNINVQTARACNLRQALQWLKEEIRPVHAVFEPLLDIPTHLDLEFYEQEQKALCAAILANEIKLYGRFGEGTIRYDEGGEISFLSYSSMQPIPVSKIVEAGTTALEFNRNRLVMITAWTDWGNYQRPEEGWEYTDVSVATADLLRVFPARSSDAGPASIELRDDFSEVPEALRDTPIRVHEPPEVAPTSTAEPTEGPEATLLRQWMSPHLRFMNAFSAIYGSKLAEWKKEVIEAEIRARWPPELGEPSQNVVGAMATLLRPPEAKRGGAKRQRSTGNGATRDGWNRSTLPEQDADAIEADEGGTP